MAQLGPVGKKVVKSLCKQNSTYVGVSGCEEDGEGWWEINVLVTKCDQHTTTCAP